MGGQPVLLLPGTGASSAMWGSLATRLAEAGYYVIAVDVIGDLGRSVLERMPSSAAELVQWLREVFVGLDIRRAHVVGMSYGSWISSQLAIHAPEMVGELVLLAPAGVFASLNAGFIIRVLPAVVWPSEVMVSRAVEYQVASSASIRPEVRRFIFAAFQVPRFRFGALPPPSVLGDEELHRITANTLLLVGDMERVTDRQNAVARARNLLSNLEVEIVPGAGHMITDEQPEFVNSRVLAYLVSRTNISKL